jgi:transglutaminase-like putative cysteine protease
VLAPYLTPVSSDIAGLMPWLRSLIGSPGEPAMEFLLRLTRAIHDDFDYQAREAEGVQAPGETLRAAGGSCRDYAWLMVEALRHLGYAARFASGYLYAGDDAATRGAGATHAWVEVFLPDLGWLQFDPTNGIAESPDLIPIAVARTPHEAQPVSGFLRGSPGQSWLTVKVEVSRDEDPIPAAA